jgi:hypothetical protein
MTDLEDTKEETDGSWVVHEDITFLTGEMFEQRVKGGHHAGCVARN